MSATYPSLHKPDRAAETASGSRLRSRRGGSPSDGAGSTGSLRPTGGHAADRAVERAEFPSHNCPTSTPTGRAVSTGPGTRDRRSARPGVAAGAPGRPSRGWFGRRSPDAARADRGGRLEPLKQWMPRARARTVISLTSSKAPGDFGKGAWSRTGVPVARLAPSRPGTGPGHSNPTPTTIGPISPAGTGSGHHVAYPGIPLPWRHGTAIPSRTLPAQAGRRGRLDDRSARRQAPARRARTRAFAVVSTLDRHPRHPRPGCDLGSKSGSRARYETYITSLGEQPEGPYDSQ
jgi:hypothetical protein